MTDLLSHDPTGQAPERVNLLLQPLRAEHPAVMLLDHVPQLRIDLDEVRARLFQQCVRCRRRQRE